MPQPVNVAVIGGGWAGLAAAIETTRLGQQATLYEMGRVLGGRARTVIVDGLAIDNGQHICIGAYSETLRLMREVGVAESAAFLRTPLRLKYPDSSGIALPGGPPLAAFAIAVLRNSGWRFSERVALLRAATQWWGTGFRCDPALTVANLTKAVPRKVRAEFVDPLCVAALNTPASLASAAVFLRVLRDALLSGRGGSDLLLPRVDLGAVLPQPAAQWLRAAGAEIFLRHRVESIDRNDTHWCVDGRRFARVAIATPPGEAARLVRSFDPSWADTADALRFEPIVTAYLSSAGTRLPEPMLTLHSSDTAPAQFVFDRGRLGGAKGLLAFVTSGAAAWADAGSDATLAAVRRQGERELAGLLRAPLEPLKMIVEKRATFLCTPGLIRPPAAIAAGLQAAGDYVEGPYPSTLEGAIRSGVAAIGALLKADEAPAARTETRLS